MSRINEIRHRLAEAGANPVPIDGPADVALRAHAEDDIRWLLEEVDMLAGLLAGAWISVEDRLPVVEQQPNGMMASRDVLAVARHWHGGVIGIACVEIHPNSGEPVWWSGRLQVDTPVTHWMPLPEKPREEE